MGAIEQYGQRAVHEEHRTRGRSFRDLALDFEHGVRVPERCFHSNVESAHARECVYRRLYDGD